MKAKTKTTPALCETSLYTHYTDSPTTPKLHFVHPSVTILFIIGLTTIPSVSQAAICYAVDDYSGSLGGYNPTYPIVLSPPAIDSSSRGLIFTSMSDANIANLQTQLVVHSSGMDIQSCATTLRNKNFYGYDIITTDNPKTGISYGSNPFYRINENISYTIVDTAYNAIVGNTMQEALSHSGFMGAYNSVPGSCFYVKGESGVPYCYPGSSTNRWKFIFRINSLPIGGVLNIPAGFTLASMTGFVNMAGGESPVALLPTSASGFHSIRFTTGSGLSVPLPVNCNITSQTITHDYGTLPPKSTRSKTSTHSLTCNMDVNGTLEIANGSSTGLTPVNIGSNGTADIGISVDNAKSASRVPFATTANVPRIFTIQTNVSTGDTSGSFSGNAIIKHVIN